MGVSILAFGAHPDDVECAAAGVLIKHIKLGKTVAIIDLTAGEMGSYGTPETRRKESENAGEIIGIQSREQLNLGDSSIFNTEENRIQVIQLIRKYQPEIVVCNAIHDRHPDHAAAAKLVADACFLAGLRKKETYYEGVIQKAWRPQAIYHYIQDYLIQPDFVIDISAEMDDKMESIRAYTSQFIDPKDEQAGSILGLQDHIISMNQLFGRSINAKFAEGFTVTKNIGVTDFYQLV